MLYCNISYDPILFIASQLSVGCSMLNMVNATQIVLPSSMHKMVASRNCILLYVYIDGLAG